MRINDNALGGVGYGDVGKSKPTTAPTEEKAAASVKITALSPEVADRASQSAAARSERVAAIAQNIRTGSYPIDLVTLAQSIATDELSRS